MNKMGIKVVKNNIIGYKTTINCIEHYNFTDGDIWFTRYINSEEYGI